MTLVGGIVAWMQKRWRRLTLAAVVVVLVVSAGFVFTPKSEARRALAHLRSGMKVENIDATVGRPCEDYDRHGLACLGLWVFDDKSQLEVLFNNDGAVGAIVQDPKPGWLVNCLVWLRNRNILDSINDFEPLP